MFDIFSEILASMKRNKLRTALTGFAVAWGIFILIVLLGSGNGLMNANSKSMNERALNSMQVGGQWTSKPYDGLAAGRYIRLNNGDLRISQQFSDHFEKVGAVLNQRGETISYGEEYISETMSGVEPVMQEIEKVSILKGRFINDIDMREYRKVMVISEKSAEVLFKHGEEPVGKYLKVGSMMYQVVGVYKDEGSNSSRIVYMPFSTLQLIYNWGDRVGYLQMTTKNLPTEEANEEFEKLYTRAIAKHQRFDPEDSGIWIWNRFTQALQMQTGNRYMTIALWVVGIFTLLSGVVGVSNIMLITVKERTHEFGIRKAIGAKPISILRLVIVESVIITAIFGYVGMVLGIGATEYMNLHTDSMVVDMGNMGSEQVFLNPTVGLDVALQATLTFIIAGTLAGLFPALKAARIRPIQALMAN